MSIVVFSHHSLQLNTQISVIVTLAQMAVLRPSHWMLNYDTALQFDKTSWQQIILKFDQHHYSRADIESVKFQSNLTI